MKEVIISKKTREKEKLIDDRLYITVTAKVT